MFCKSPERILGFVGHTFSVAITQLCYCKMKSAIGNTQINRCGCVPIKLYLQNHSVGWICPMEFANPWPRSSLPYPWF